MTTPMTSHFEIFFREVFDRVAEPAGSGLVSLSSSLPYAMAMRVIWVPPEWARVVPPPRRRLLDYCPTTTSLSSKAQTSWLIELWSFPIPIQSQISRIPIHSTTTTRFLKVLEIWFQAIFMPGTVKQCSPCQPVLGQVRVVREAIWSLEMTSLRFWIP